MECVRLDLRAHSVNGAEGRRCRDVLRFVAKVPWMKRDDSLDVTLSVEYSEKVRTVNFEKFIPR